MVPKLYTNSGIFLESTRMISVSGKHVSDIQFIVLFK